MTKKVCVIPADDLGPEMVLPAVDILQSMRVDIEFVWPSAGMSAFQKFGTSFPPETKQAVDKADCTFFGTSNRASGPERSGVPHMRWGKRLYTNLRPIKYYEGMPSHLKNPHGIDFVIVRELLEGLYPGREGELAEIAFLKNMKIKYSDRLPLDTSSKGAYAVRVITEENTRNIFQAACQVARKRKAKGFPGKVTTAQKLMMLARTDGLWRQIGEEIVAQYPELAFESMDIDSFAYQLARNPQQFDVVVLANEHGDILSEEAMGLLSGSWVAASAYIGKNYAYFEPISGGGSSVEDVGKNRVNPTGAILAAVYMLEYLGYEAAAQELEQAVGKVFAEGKCLTQDMGGVASTFEFCEQVKAALLI